MKSANTLGVLLLGCLAAARAHAGGRLADVELIDRDTGRKLEAHYHHGEYWVAGEPGARYAIEIHNRLGERLLAVMSVDGVNVITGQSAGWDQAGYVFEPWETYEVAGWRKSDYQIAAFAFTAAPRSYAARTGRPENVGVVGLALFREQPSEGALSPIQPPIANGAPEAAPPLLQPPRHAERQSDASVPAAPDSKFSDRSANTIAGAPFARAPALGTAHGEREFSYVGHTSFLRRQSRPDEIIQIRYDSLANLIAMGIVRPRHEDVRPTPFPETADQYVPDPPPFDPAVPR